jgi:hypothetical protein
VRISGCAPLNLKISRLRHIVPFSLQFCFYISPVGFTSKAPLRAKWLITETDHLTAEGTKVIGRGLSCREPYRHLWKTN